MVDNFFGFYIIFSSVYTIYDINFKNPSFLGK